MKFPIFISSIILLITLSISPPSHAEDVEAVKSVDILPYREAVKGFRNVVKANVFEYVIENGDNSTILLRLKGADLIFTLGSDVLTIVKDEIRDKPIVFIFVLNPNAVIKSQSPHITGIDINIPPEEQFNALLQVAPQVKRIGVICDPSKSQSIIDEAEAAAKKLGVSLVIKKIDSKEEAINAISMLEGNVDAIWMSPDTTAITPESINYMLLFAFRNRIPVIGISDKYVKSGVLLALSFDSEYIGRQAGEIANRILEGEDIKEFSLVKPRMVKLSINLNTAEKIGIKIPERVIRLADRVYR